MRSMVLVVGALSLTGSAAIMLPSPDDALAKAVTEVERLNGLRESLARQFEANPAATEGRFLEVCRPVEVEAQRIASENGWKVQQLADKYRNPVNRADREALHFLHQLAADTSVQGMWVRTAMNGQPGVRYFRRITVREACMPCHGTREARPTFIRDGYPLDRAYNFEVGDIRGVYSVFVPDAPTP
jgi:hypothetical protein